MQVKGLAHYHINTPKAGGSYMSVYSLIVASYINLLPVSPQTITWTNGDSVSTGQSDKRHYAIRIKTDDFR